MWKLTTKPRVLHVDDNEDFLEVFSATFEDAFEITSVLSAEDVLEQLRRKRFDVLITDYELEETNGLDLLKVIRKAFPGLPVIFFTGQGNEEIAREAFISGASDYFTKDFSDFAYKEKIENSIVRAIEKRITEEALVWELKVNEAIARLSTALIKSDTLEKISSLVFDSARELTNCSLGFVGYFDKQNGNLICSNMSSNVWQDEEEQVEQDSGDTPRTGTGRLWEWALTNHEPLYSNSPDCDDRFSGVPNEGITVKNFLTAPALIDDELVGQIALGDADHEFSDEDLKVAERLASLYALAIQRREAERALMESMWRFRQLFQKANDAIFIHDIYEDGMPGKFVEVNEIACKRLGYAREELLKLELKDIYAEGRYRDICMVMPKFLRKGNVTFDTVHVTRNGKLIPTEVNMHSFHIDGNHVVLSFAHDISERKKVEEDLVAKNKELEDYAYIVSHDLKGSANLIRGYLTCIRQNPDLFEEHYEKVIKQANHIISFIDNLLKLSRAGKIIDKTKDIHLEPFIKNVFSVKKLDDVQAELRIGSNLPVVNCDPACLEQVFNNLFENSFNYRDPKKETVIIEVGTKVHNNEALLFVKDNGIGISQNHLSKIFAPGFTLRKDTGTGFGLAIAKRIIEAHGGEIWVESQGIGAGTTFLIKLR